MSSRLSNGEKNDLLFVMCVDELSLSCVINDDNKGSTG